MSTTKNNYVVRSLDEIVASISDISNNKNPSNTLLHRAVNCSALASVITNPSVKHNYFAAMPETELRSFVQGIMELGITAAGINQAAANNNNNNNSNKNNSKKTALEQQSAAVEVNVGHVLFDTLACIAELCRRESLDEAVTKIRADQSKQVQLMFVCMFCNGTLVPPVVPPVAQEEGEEEKEGEGEKTEKKQQQKKGFITVYDFLKFVKLQAGVKLQSSEDVELIVGMCSDLEVALPPENYTPPVSVAVVRPSTKSKEQEESEKKKQQEEKEEEKQEKKKEEKNEDEGGGGEEEEEDAPPELIPNQQTIPQKQKKNKKLSSTKNSSSSAGGSGESSSKEKYRGWTKERKEKSKDLLFIDESRQADLTKIPLVARAPRFYCTNCSKEGDAKSLSMCANCRSTFYCCQNCQLESWPQHKLVCLPVKKFLFAPTTSSASAQNQQKQKEEKKKRKEGGEEEDSIFKTNPNLRGAFSALYYENRAFQYSCRADMLASTSFSDFFMEYC